MTLITTLTILLLSSFAALAQAAPKGFSWKHFSELGVTVQVPDGWHSRVLNEKGTKAIQITKEKPDARGFETGLTVNLIQRKTDAEMSAAILGVGGYMAKLHDTFTKLIESRVTENKGIPTMILDGVRNLPDQKERGLYHTRTVVHIFKPSRRIYTLVFGSPADRWDADYKLGHVMLSPILFDE